MEGSGMEMLKSIENATFNENIKREIFNSQNVTNLVLGELEGVTELTKEKLEIIKEKITQEFSVTETQVEIVAVAIRELYKVDNTFIQIFGYNGLLAYFSIHYEDEAIRSRFLKHVVSEFGDKYLKKQLFAKNAECVLTANNINTEQNLQFENLSKKQIEIIKQKVITKGVDFLEAIGKFYAAGTMSLIGIMDKLDAEAEMFKTVFSTGIGTYENIKDSDFNILSGPEVAKNEKDVDKMKEIYLRNYPYYQYNEEAGFSQEFQQELLKSLDNNLKNPSSKFYILRHKGEIVAFNSFTPQKDGTVLFANFNVDPLYNDSKIGEVMMHISLDEHSKKTPVVAMVLPNTKIAKFYMEKKNFKQYGEVEIAGVRVLKIRREQTREN